MTKKDIADFLKKKYTLSNKDAMSITESFFLTISKLACHKGGVQVKNLGKFEFKEKLVQKYIHDFKSGNGEIKRMIKSKIYFTPARKMRDL